MSTRYFEVEVATGNSPRRSRDFAIDSLPEIGDPLGRWRIQVMHDEECPSTKIESDGDEIDFCTCELLTLRAEWARQQSLDVALQNPAFILGLFRDGIIMSFRHDNPEEGS